MKPKFWSMARSGVLAIGLTAAFGAPSIAAPLTPLNLPEASSASPAVVPVGRNCRGPNDCRQFKRFDRSKRFWRKHANRHHYRPRHHYRRPSIHFELSIPTYRYVQPRYVPAPVYRYRLSAAHVDWCYDRYLSYRVSDNTFQPYHGPRKQCWSPYS